MNRVSDHDVYDAVCGWWKDDGKSPTMRDLAGVMGVAASTACRHLVRLQEAGAIEPIDGRSAAIKPTGHVVSILGDRYAWREVR